jgi:secreted trypsin-like serine protease
VKVLPEAGCRGVAITKYDEATELCVSSTSTATACFGDSGGPAVYMANGRLVGVTSRGSGPCGQDADTIYTRVLPYLGWITKATA